MLDIGHAANLACGVTAGPDVQAFDPDMFGYADMIDAGLMTGKRAVATAMATEAAFEQEQRKAASVEY